MEVDSEDMRMRLLPSPLRCLNAIKVTILKKQPKGSPISIITRHARKALQQLEQLTASCCRAALSSE